jgi:ATP-dependent exoDNAse (exonuclease V) beta subunit
MTPPDQPTRDLITYGGLDQTLFVEAGAGSGKTSALVDRIVNLVIERGVELSSVAAITFTEAAAAELQARIRARFEQTRDAVDTTDSQRERAAAAIEDADRAAISTLHGFASRMLSEFAVAARLPPQVRVLDEVSSQLAAEDRWQRFVDGLYDDPDNDELLVRAALLGVPLEPSYSRQPTLKDVAADFNQNWDRLPPVIEKMTHPPAPLPPIDFSEVDRAATSIMACIDGCTDPDDIFYVHLTTTVIPELERLADIDDPVRRAAAMSEVKPPSKKGLGFGRTNGGAKGNWGGDVASVKQLINDLNDAMTAVVADARSLVIERLVGPIAGDVLEAAEQRRSDGGLEFHDLLVLAREMLRSDEEARLALHAKYTHLLLDEFQDTDPIQIELALRIAAAVAPGDEDWQSLDVESGRLFFVGDPKQSIYRFRRADISLFLEARQRFGPDGTHAKLTTNFRTVEPILDWVNVLFGQLMGSGVDERQPAYERLVAHRPADSGADHRPILLGGPHRDKKVRAAELRELEAADVAAVLADIVARPEAWPVGDGHGGWRPAELADVAILVPTRTSLPFLRAALEDRDISYRLSTGTLVYTTQEVADLLAALRAIDDPTDELSLVAALRSPLYACADTDLFTFVRAGGRWDLRSAPPVELDVTHPVCAAFAHLRGLWEERWWTPPSALLDRLMRDREAAMLGYGSARPADVWRRLRFLLDQARSFEESVGGDLRGFLEWAQLQGADLARVHEPLLPETDDDAVRIMTIHGSKGLEFPITILSGMTTRLDGRRQGIGVLWREDGRPEVRVRKDAATLGFDARATVESEMDQYEKQRLLYVGLTRARDHLIVSAHHKASESDSSFAGLVWDERDRVDLWRGLPPFEPAAPVSSRPLAVPLPLDDRSAWVAGRVRLIEENRVPRVLSATSIAVTALAPQHEGDDGAAIVDTDDDGADQPDDGVVPSRRRGRAGSAIGSATHAVLQMVDLADPVDLDLHVRQQCAIEAIPEHEGVVALLARSALSSEAVALAVAHRHHKELFVAAPIGDRAIEGYIDLLIDTPDGLVVVDYKTDSARSNEEIDAKLAAYELQGASYAVAVEAVVGRPVIDCRFVFCGTKGAVERSVADLDGLKQSVRGLLTDPAPGNSPV